MTAILYMPILYLYQGAIEKENVPPVAGLLNISNQGVLQPVTKKGKKSRVVTYFLYLIFKTLMDFLGSERKRHFTWKYCQE